MLNRGLDKQELLRIVEAVANEKSIDKEIDINGPILSNSDVFRVSKRHNFATSDNKDAMISPSSLVSNIPPWEKTMDTR